jgi:hypothetical protein
MSARNENFEFAREFLFSRIVDTEAGVTEEEGGEKVTTWENQVVEIYPRGNNGVEIFAILDTGARRQLRVNMRTGFMHLNPGNLRLVEASGTKCSWKNSWCAWSARSVSWSPRLCAPCLCRTRPVRSSKAVCAGRGQCDRVRPSVQDEASAISADASN